MPAPLEVSYRIDAADRITFVDDSWTHAAQRSGDQRLLPEAVVGRTLWEFLSDDDTKKVYRQLVERVRSGRSAQFHLRCDTPSARQILEMSMQPTAAGGVEFATRIVRSVERAPVAMSMYDAANACDVVLECSWCNRIEVASGEWLELEEAISRLQLFERSTLPRRSHGMCPMCAIRMSFAIAKLGDE